MTGRGLRGRRQARVILTIAIAIDLIVILLFVAQPNYMGPMRFEPPSPVVGWLVLAVGIAANLLGLAWMIRIYRADSEGHPRSFRATRD